MYAGHLKIYMTVSSAADRYALQFTADGVAVSHGLPLAVNRTTVLSLGTVQTDPIYKMRS